MIKGDKLSQLQLEPIREVQLNYQLFSAQMLTTKISYLTRNFRGNFNLEFKPTLKGMLRRFDRNHNRTAKVVKFGLSFSLLITTAYLIVPGSFLPYQSKFRLWVYKRIMGANYVWLMMGEHPDKELYLIKLLQLTLMAINNSCEDWDWVINQLRKSLVLKTQGSQTEELYNQIGFKQNELSAAGRISALLYSSLILSKMARLNVKMLKQDRTIQTFDSILNEHLSYVRTHKQTFTKKQVQSLGETYIIMQYLLKYQPLYTADPSIKQILVNYLSIIKARKMNSFIERVFRQNAFLQSLKSSYSKNPTTADQITNNSLIISIFEELDSFKKEMDSKDRKN